MMKTVVIFTLTTLAFVPEIVQGFSPPILTVNPKGSSASSSLAMTSNMYENFFYEQDPSISPNIAPPQPEPTQPQSQPQPPQEQEQRKQRLARSNISKSTGPPRYEPPAQPLSSAVAPLRHKQALNIGPLLGYDKGYPWIQILGPHQHFDTRLNYVEDGPPGKQGQAVNIGPLLGYDKGFPWKNVILAQQRSVALRNHYVEDKDVAKKPKLALDVGPLLALDKGMKWKERLGPAATERCRMETFVQ